MKFTFNDCIKIKTQKEDITAPFQLMFSWLCKNKQKATW